MTKLEPIEDLIYDTLRQGRIFAEAWENAAIETTGTMSRLGPELCFRLKKGDCLNEDDTNVLPRFGETILDARARIRAQLDDEESTDLEYLGARKIELDLLMVYFTSYWDRRQRVFDRQKTEQIYLEMF